MKGGVGILEVSRSQENLWENFAVVKYFFQPTHKGFISFPKLQS